MNKEEFIKLIETLEFEELRCANISYYKKKPSRYNYGDEDVDPKTICIGTDLERLISDNEKCNHYRFNDLYSEIEKLKSGNNK